VMIVVVVVVVVMVNKDDPCFARDVS